MSDDNHEAWMAAGAASMSLLDALNDDLEPMLFELKDVADRIQAHFADYGVVRPKDAVMNLVLGILYPETQA